MSGNTLHQNRRKQFRVFHGLVNYGTQSGLFANKLREYGIDAISVTNYDSFARITDVTLKSSGRNFLERVFNIINNHFIKAMCFFKYDVYHFYFGITLLRNQWDLPLYRIFNKKVVFHYLGVDVQLYQTSIDKYEITNVRYYLKNGPEHDKKTIKRLKYESKYADLQLVCAPYLSEFVPNSSVLPLAIDVEEYSFCPKGIPSEDFVIMHAPTSRDNKGTSYIINAIDQLIEEGYKIRKLLVENVSHTELKEKYKECDIFVDQILAGWYGTASIEAMAIGRPTVCFIREDYFKYINYGPDIPIINATPQTIYPVLKNLIDNKDQLPTIGLRSRMFAENIHNANKLTLQLVSLYDLL